MYTLNCRTAWEPAESLCSITNQHQLKPRTVTSAAALSINLVFNPKGRRRTQHQELMWLQSLALPQRISCTYNSTGQSRGEGLSKAQGYLCHYKNKLVQQALHWLGISLPGLVRTICPQNGALPWFRQGFRELTANSFCDLPGRSQGFQENCSVKKDKNLNSLRRLQHFQSSCQGMGGTEQRASCLPVNTRNPDGTSQFRGALQPWGAGASPTHNPAKPPPVPLPHSLAGPGAAPRLQGRVTGEQQWWPGQGAALCSGYTRSSVNHTSFQADSIL